MKMDDEEFISTCYFASSKQIIHAIKNGANVNAKDEFGVTPLMAVAMNNENFVLNAVQALLDKGVDVNAHENDGITALMFSVQDEYSHEVAEILIDAGADINAQDSSGQTALFHAAQWCLNEKTIELLIDAGADVKIKDDEGKMAVDYARENEVLKDSEILERLEELSKEINY